VSDTKRPAGLEFDRILLDMMSKPDQYLRLLMTIPVKRIQEFEEDFGDFGAGLFDARSPSLQSVFAPDILAQGLHLVLIMAARHPVPKGEDVYRSLGKGMCRKMLFGLAPAKLGSFYSKLKGYLDPTEADAVTSWSSSKSDHIMLEPKPGALGVIILRGIHPEAGPA